MRRLTVFHDNNSVFTDLSYEAYDFSRDNLSITLISAEDYLYVGFEKAFDSFYAEMSTANTNANTFTAEFYNGTSWTALSNFIDDSQGFTRSGFLSWDLAQTDWAANTVNSSEKYWVRFKPDADHSATVLRGLNILFSDDQALKDEFFEIADFLPSGETTHIIKHQAVKREIVQRFRNRGIRKIDSNNNYVDMDEFDLLQKHQIKEAAKFMALEKIFRNISDQIDDKWASLRDEFRKKANDSLEVAYLTFDRDDDGAIDDVERVAVNAVRIKRV